MSCCYYTGMKSSVYNQTGESFFKQLSAYNHMSAHLRRIMLAKSRVDSRNPNYLRRQRTMSTGRAKFTGKTASQELVDQLAYDTEHHPMEIFRMRYSSDSRSPDRSRKCPGACNNFLIDCSGSHVNPPTSRLADNNRSRSASRSRPRGSGLSFHSARPGTFKKSYTNRDDEKDDIISSHPDESAHSSPRSIKNKDENDQTDYNYASSFESTSETSPRGSIASKGSISSQNYAENILTTKNREKRENSLSKMTEETKYSKFLYDITQEIVQNGLYKDEELKEVFKKHIKSNSHVLDRSKMMYKIYQLKLSLNLIDHDNDDDEEEETIDRFLHSSKYSASHPVKPPTPPKVLDENKIVDKLMNPEELKATYSKSPHSGRHTVVLVDANPELLITERDILATLMEMNMRPQEAHDVYKRLQKRSRDLHTVQMVDAKKMDTTFTYTEERPETRRSRPNKVHQHQFKYPETLDKEHNIDHTYFDTKDDTRISGCRCVSSNHDLYDDFYSSGRQISCLCNPRLHVKLINCPGVPPSPLSTKAKPLNEKNVIDVDKRVKSTEMTGFKCFCPTRVTSKRNLSVQRQRKRDADMRNIEKVRKYVETVKVKPDKLQEKKINDLKSKSKSSVPLKKLKSSNKDIGSKDLKKRDKKDDSRDNVSSSRSSQLSLIDRKDPVKRATSYKLSRDIEKSSSIDVKSSVMKESTKSPKVQKEIKPQHSDESDGSIVESYSDDESIAEENSTHFKHKVDNERSESKRNSISDEDDEYEEDDEIAEEIDNVKNTGNTYSSFK